MKNPPCAGGHSLPPLENIVLRKTSLNDKGKEIKEQIKKYSSLVDKILNENKNDINYSSINKKNNYFKEIEDIFFNTLDGFILVEK